jgi:SRSO17 transposase
VSFHGRYAQFFTTATRSVVSQAQHYLSGLVQAEHKNMERMTEVVPDTEYQALQHFLSHSPWQSQPVMDQVARDGSQLLGGGPDTGLILDETSFVKKGKKSAGVARQYCGSLGKVENCQVGVFASLVRGSSSVLVDGRLYIPQEWFTDRDRCRAAGIPDEVVFQTKSELARASIRHARELGLDFAWVGADGGYGKEPQFLSDLDDDGELFVADVHKDQPIYLEDPAPYLPPRKSGKGRTPSRFVTDAKPLRVDKWAANQPEAAWQPITTRAATKGDIQVDLLVARVWSWNKAETTSRQWFLVVRREVDAPEEIKYSLSNAPADTSAERLAFMQGQRYFVERAFQNAKGTAGMDHYQVRGLLAWQHHMTLVMLAMLFMQETRQEQQKTYPLLSCPDIVTLLARFLPRRDLDPDELIRQMEVRHRQRQASIDSASSRNLSKLGSLKL